MNTLKKALKYVYGFGIGYVTALIPFFSSQHTLTTHDCYMALIGGMFGSHLISIMPNDMQTELTTALSSLEPSGSAVPTNYVQGNIATSNAITEVQSQRRAD